MDGWVGAQKHGQMNEWTYGWVCAETLTDEWVDTEMDGLIDAWMDGWPIRWMDRWAEAWTDK